VDEGRIPRPTASGTPPPGQGSYVYPSPTTLARRRAEASGLASDWGLVGGLMVLERYGVDHFRAMASIGKRSRR